MGGGEGGGRRYICVTLLYLRRTTVDLGSTAFLLYKLFKKKWKFLFSSFPMKGGGGGKVNGFSFSLLFVL